MNMKDAFRFQNRIKSLMCEATSILQDRRNIVKVKTTHLLWWRRPLPASMPAMPTR